MRPTLDASLMKYVQIDDVIAWLTSRGWRQRMPFPRADVLVFDGPLADDGEPLTAVFPSVRSASDFLEELAVVLDLVAAVEGRTLDDVAVSLAFPDLDTTRSRAFLGAVVGLLSDGDDERIATLRFDENGRGKLQSARMHLTEADYKVACDAHRDGRAVALKGRLERRGNRWWIADIDGFSAVPKTT